MDGTTGCGERAYTPFDLDQILDWFRVPGRLPIIWCYISTARMLPSYGREPSSILGSTTNHHLTKVKNHIQYDFLTHERIMMKIEDTRKYDAEKIELFSGQFFVDYPWVIMVFSTYHQLDNKGLDGVFMLQRWVKDNLGYEPLTTYGRFYFKEEGDAIAFKLRWG